MKFISRKDAILSGLKWYFTGNPCHKGHIAERQCSNRKCKICSKEKTDEWRMGNPEKSRESSRRWKLNNPFKNSETSKNWRLQNAKKVSDYNKLYIIGWVEKNRGKVRAANSMRRAQLMLAAPKWLSEEQIDEIDNIYLSARKLEEESGEKYHVDHIVPLRGKFVSGLHVPWNLQVISQSENLKKGRSHND